MKHRINRLDFGRTGPAVVLSCGCDVLPWEDCRHTAWDAGKSVDRVIAEAREPELPLFAEAPAPPPPSLAVVLPRSIIARFRELASWYERGTGKRGKIARRLLADLDAALMPADQRGIKL
jgi:hypothetical protein